MQNFKNIKYCKLNSPKLLQDTLYFLFSIMSIGLEENFAHISLNYINNYDNNMFAIKKLFFVKNLLIIDTLTSV